MKMRRDIVLMERVHWVKINRNILEIKWLIRSRNDVFHHLKYNAANQPVALGDSAMRMRLKLRMRMRM